MNELKRFALIRGIPRALLLTIPMGLVACGPSPSQYTVEYYQAHPAERKAKLEQCANDPGALREDVLCVNARQAGLIEGIGSLDDWPPTVGKVDKKQPRERESDGQRQPQ